MRRRFREAEAADRSRGGAQELVAEERLVGAFAGEDRFIARIADTPAEQKACCAVGIVLDRLGVTDGVREVIGQRRVAQGHHGVIRSRRDGHLSRAVRLVVGAAFETHREGCDGSVGAGGRDAEDRRRVQASAEKAADGYPGDHAKADGLFGQLPDPFDTVLQPGGVRIGALPDPEHESAAASRRRGQVPVAFHTHPTVTCAENVPGRHLGNPPEQRSPLIRAGVKRVVDRVRIPRPW